MSKIIYLYPKLFNATTKGDIRIVEGCYNEDIKIELNNYIKQIIDLRKENEELRSDICIYCGATENVCINCKWNTRWR